MKTLAALPLLLIGTTVLAQMGPSMKTTLIGGDLSVLKGQEGSEVRGSLTKA
ncbi:MAG: hypothetical protein IPG74_16285 [Flavobacteriales bacterium]|nr:hypothetical protein [Flavobacteriales bacterium]